jgi:hypothetical protein
MVLIEVSASALAVRSCLKFTLNIISVVIAKPFKIKIKVKRLWQ